MWRNAMMLAVAMLGASFATACRDDADTGAGPASSVTVPAASVCAASARPRAALAMAESVLAPVSGSGAAPFGDDFVRRAIDDDPRDVLPGLASREISYPKRLALPEAIGEPVRWRVPIRAGQFEGVDRFVVVPRVGITGVGLRQLPPVMVSAGEDPHGRHVAIDVDLAGLPTGRGEASLAGTLIAAPLAAESIHETRLLDAWPDPTWLEISFGVLDVGVDRGRVRFRLESCSASSGANDGVCTCLHEEVVDPATPGGRGWQERTIRLDGLEAAPRTLRFVATAVDESNDAGRVLLAE